MAMDAPTRALLEDATQFIYREARLQDEHRYEEWEALWTDDAVYWVPANGEQGGEDGGDPEQVMSIIYDNRSRIRLRIRQLCTGKRLSQLPRSRLRRLVSNIELLGREGDDVRVGCNAMVYESHTRGENVWVSRNEYTLRVSADGLRMARKNVVLVNNDRALLTMAFLI